MIKAAVEKPLFFIFIENGIVLLPTVMETIVNKVAESGIVTLDLSAYLPEENSFAIFDLKPFLFREMILKEKDFRASLQEYDWTQYKDKNVAVFCSVDAIIPVWAFMLVTNYLQPQAKHIFFGKKEEQHKQLTTENINSIDTNEFKDKRLVLKGCGDVTIPEYAYVAATAKLLPVVKALMYGEPCSTVPIFKKK